MSDTQHTVAKRPETVRDWLNSDAFKGEIAKALPSICTPDRFLRVALTALTKTPKLADCDPKTVLRSMLDCAALGIEPDGRRAHLIPYGRECQLVIDYKGLIELVRRSGGVSKLHADVVCEADTFDADLGEIRAHKIDYRADRGKVYAVYALAVLADGSQQSAVMTRAEVEAIRARSRAGRAGPWVTDWSEMAKKTALRRLIKLLPLSAEVHDAAEKDADALPPIEKPGARKSAFVFAADADASPALDVSATEPSEADIDAAMGKAASAADESDDEVFQRK